MSCSFIKIKLLKLQMMAKRFAYGWGFHSFLTIFLSIPVLVRNPRELGLLFSSNKSLKFGAFLASLAGIYQVNSLTNSSLNHILNPFIYRQRIVCCDEYENATAYIILP